MSEVAETLTRKKKGRPSLLDLQKRAIKQQQLQKFHDDHRSAPKNPNSLNSGSRSKRRNPNRNRVSSDDDEDEEDDDERREKKHRLLRGLNTHSRRHSPNSKPGGAAHGSGYTGLPLSLAPLHLCQTKSCCCSSSINFKRKICMVFIQILLIPRREMCF